MHVETGTRREMPMEKTDASKPSKGGAPRVACDYHLSNERHMTFSLEFSGCWGIERRGDPARPLKQSVVRSAKRVKEEVRFGCAGSERKGAIESAFLGDACKGTGLFSASPPAIASSPPFIGHTLP